MRKSSLIPTVMGLALVLGAVAFAIFRHGQNQPSPTRPGNGLPGNFEIALDSCPRAFVAGLGHGCSAIYDTENGRLHAFLRGGGDPVRIAGLSSTGRAEDTNRLTDNILWREERSPAWSSSPPGAVHRHLGWSETADGSSHIRHAFTFGDSAGTVTVRETLRPAGPNSWQRAFEVSGLPPQTTLSLALPPPQEAWSVSSASATLSGGNLTFAADGNAVLTRNLAH